MSTFVEGRKLDNSEKNPWSKARTNDKLNPLEKASTGIETGSQRWEAMAYPLCHSCAPKLDSILEPVLNTNANLGKCFTSWQC